MQGNAINLPLIDIFLYSFLRQWSILEQHFGPISSCAELQFIANPMIEIEINVFPGYSVVNGLVKRMI